MRLFKTIAGLRCYLAEIRLQHHHTKATDPSGCALSPRVGLVPTMGALHAGHLSLIERARQENDCVVVSIFVNPLQFGPNEDYLRYPRDLEQDRALCQAAGVDAIFAPSPEELYGSSDTSHKTLLTQVVPPAAMMAGLCGRTRIGHFEGVATVVTKLLSIVQPQRAYFGQKDAQQLAILRRVVTDLNLPVTVVGCPIVREANGLAMSSRNQYLTEGQRSTATVLHRSLHKAEELLRRGHCLSTDLIDVVKTEIATTPEVRLEYVELVDPDTMQPIDRVDGTGLLAIAAHVGTTRLIDNLLLRNRKPILAIDGPAGSGKSTVVRQVAQELQLLYLNTGAMYRAVTWLVLHSGIAVQDEAAIAELVSQCDIVLEDDRTGLDAVALPRVWINGQDVTHEIRSLEVTAHVSAISAQPAVRRELVRRQQIYGRRGGVVMEGRDIGTHVFPDAELKIFLTASVQERARRRMQDLISQGEGNILLADLEQSIKERDRKDSTRCIAPLQKAPDAIEIQTDDLTVDEVTAKIVGLYRQKLAESYNAAVL